MSEKETIFSSKIKNTGIFSFRDFYKFCHQWLTDEANLSVSEDKYKERLKGNTKDIEIVWTCIRKITDYFMFEVKVKFVIDNLTDVELSQEEAKIKTNKGAVEVEVKGNLVRDYDGKFEKTGFSKFTRGIYEKWVIASRIEQFENKLAGDCDEFLNQAKAWLDLEGKK